MTTSSFGEVREISLSKFSDLLQKYVIQFKKFRTYAPFTTGGFVAGTKSAVSNTLIL